MNLSPRRIRGNSSARSPAPRLRRRRRPAGLAAVVVGAILVLTTGMSSASGAGSEVVDEVHYTFTGATSVAFDWRGAATEIRYGLDSSYGSAATAVTDPLPWSSPGPYREAQLGGLEPGTTYHYSIGDGPDHTFSTAPTGDFRFDVEADVGTSIHASTAMTQADIAADDPAFVLVPGDLSYAGDYEIPNTNLPDVPAAKAAVDRHFNDLMAWSQGAAYIPAWGNHDWTATASPSDDLLNYKGRFAIPHGQGAVGAPDAYGEDWGWFDAGGVRFISYPEPYVSNTWTKSVDGWRAQAAPLFAAAQADPNIRYIVTFGHRPAYSTGLHPGNATLAGVLDVYGNTYSKYVLNLNGHSHNYERFRPIHGVTHVTSGGGGEEQESVSGPPADRTVVRALHLEHLRVDVSSSQMRIEAVCGVDTKYDDTACTHGSVLDAFTIAAPRPAPVPTVSSPADGSTTAATAPTFGGTAGTATGDASSVTVKVYAGTTTGGPLAQTRTASVPANGTWSVTASPALADGTYTVTAEQSGANGTATSAPSTFTVDAASADSTAPTSAASAPTTTSSSAMTISYTASDGAGTGLRSLQLWVKPPGASLYALAGTRDAPGSSGTFSYAAGMGNGTYAFSTVGIDRAGNREALPATADAPVKLSLPLPAKPGITAPPPESYNTTGIVTVAGTSSASSEVTLSDAGVVLTATAADGSGTWGRTVTALPDGVHSFTAKATDQSMNTSLPSDAVSVTVDTAPPSSKATAGSYSTSTSIHVTYDAQDATAGLAQVELLVCDPGATDFVVARTDTTGSATGTFSYDAEAGDGSYEFSTVAVDKAGNREALPAAADAVVMVDTTKPVVAIDAPPSDAWVKSAVPTFQGTAGTATGDHDTVTVEVFDGASAIGEPLQTLTTQPDPSTGAWSVPASSALAAGAYTVRASQDDAAGNTGSASHTFRVDTAAPTLATLTPGAGDVLNDTTPSFSGTAGVADGDQPTVIVRVFAGAFDDQGLPVGMPVQAREATPDASGVFSVDANPTLAQGTYTVQAYQDDAAGNQGKSAPHTFTIDSEAPTVTLVHPAGGSVTNDTTPTLDGVAGTAPGDDANVTVEIYDGSDASGTPAQTLEAPRDPSSGEWSVTPGSALVEGEHTIRAAQSDAADNVDRSEPHTVTVDTTPPTVVLDQPAAGSATNDATPTIDGTAGTAAGDSLTVQVRVFAGDRPTNTPVRTHIAVRQASAAAWSVDASPALADGTYTADASQADAADNVRRSSAHTFVVDTSAPRSEAARATLTAAGSIDVTYDARDVGPAGLHKVELYARDPRGGAFGLAASRTAPAATGTFTFAAAAGAGTYAFYTVATDRAGNREAAPATPDASATTQSAPPPSPPPPSPPGAEPSEPALAVTFKSPAKQRIAHVLRRGLATTLSCSAPCTARIVVRVPAPMAAKLGLARRGRSAVVGRARTEAAGSGAHQAVRVKLRKPARRAIAPLRKLALRVEANVTRTAGGGPALQSARAVVLRR